MTTYASNAPYPSEGVDRFHVWSDGDEGEVHMVPMAVGVMDVAARRGRATSWANYWCTLAEIHALAALGVVITDRWGPTEFMARRGDNAKMLAHLNAARFRGCV